MPRFSPQAAHRVRSRRSMAQIDVIASIAPCRISGVNTPLRTWRAASTKHVVQASASSIRHHAAFSRARRVASATLRPSARIFNGDYHLIGCIVLQNAVAPVPQCPSAPVPCLPCLGSWPTTCAIGVSGHSPAGGIDSMVRSIVSASAALVLRGLPCSAVICNLLHLVTVALRRCPHSSVPITAIPSSSISAFAWKKPVTSKSASAG